MAGNQDAFNDTVNAHTSGGLTNGTGAPADGTVRAHPATGYRQVATRGGWANQDEPNVKPGEVLHNGFAKDPSTLSEKELDEVRVQVKHRGAWMPTPNTKAQAIAQGQTFGSGADHPAVKAELAKIAAGKVFTGEPKPAATERPSRRPPNRVRGTDVQPTLPGMKLVNHADKTHRQYHTIAATLAASKDPVVADMGNTALTHLSGAKGKIEEAKAEYSRGGDAQFHGNERVIESHPLIQAAHNTLDNEYVRSYGERAGVNTELPHESLAKLKEGVDTATVLKKADSMPDINFGGTSRRLDSPEIKEAEKRARTDESPVAQAAGAKIRAAKRGTPRMYARERNTPVEGSVTGEDMEATTPMGAGRNGRGPRAKKPVSSSPRMTPVQRVRTPASKSAPKTNVSNGSKVGVTPKFDATSGVEGGDAGMAPKKGKK
jgi:hypothetical protein